jgi:hypothetical protein
VSTGFAQARVDSAIPVVSTVPAITQNVNKFDNDPKWRAGPDIPLSLAAEYPAPRAGRGYSTAAGAPCDTLASWIDDGRRRVDGPFSIAPDDYPLLDPIWISPGPRKPARSVPAGLPSKVPSSPVFRQRIEVIGSGGSACTLTGSAPVRRSGPGVADENFCARPEYTASPARRALGVLYEPLDARTEEYRAVVSTDAALIVHNRLTQQERARLSDVRPHLPRARQEKPIE